jgi:hypothetical protein
MTAALLVGSIDVVVLAVLWRLKPTTLRLSLSLTKWVRLELESESGAPHSARQAPFPEGDAEGVAA